MRLCAKFLFTTLFALVFLFSPSHADAGELATAASQMRAGTWRQLSTNNMYGALGDSAGASGNILTYSDNGVWYPGTKSFYFVGGDHNGVARFVRFQESTNTWSIMPQPSWIGSFTMHAYDHTAIDTSRGHIYHRPFGQTVVRRYAISSRLWIDLPTNFASESNLCCVGIDWFPGERDSLVWAGLELNEYTAASGWINRSTDLPMGNQHNFAEYNPVHEIVVFGGGYGDNSNAVYRFDADGKIKRQDNAPIGLGIQSTIFTVDPVSGEYLVLTSAGEFWIYDVINDSWQMQPETPEVIADLPYPGYRLNSIVATPISDFGVVMLAKCNQTDCTVWLYNHSPSKIVFDPTPPAAPSNLLAH